MSRLTVLLLLCLPLLSGCPSMGSALAPDEIVAIPAKQSLILGVAVPQIEADMPDWETDRWDKEKVMALILAMQRSWDALDAYYGDGELPEGE